jgi:hypothetical protein
MSANENITSALRDFVRDVLPPEGRSEQALYVKTLAFIFDCDVSLVRAQVRWFAFEASPRTPGDCTQELNHNGYRDDLEHDYLNCYGAGMINDYRKGDLSPAGDRDYNFMLRFFTLLSEKSERKLDETILDYLRHAGCFEADVNRLIRLFTEKDRFGGPGDIPERTFPMMATPEYTQGICAYFECILEVLAEARKRIMDDPALLEKTHCVDEADEIGLQEKEEESSLETFPYN